MLSSGFARTIGHPSAVPGGVGVPLRGPQAGELVCELRRRRPAEAGGAAFEVKPRRPEQVQFVDPAGDAGTVTAIAADERLVEVAGMADQLDGRPGGGAKPAD